MRLAPIAVAVCSLIRFSVGLVHAQEYDAATDKELFAAYCSGVLHQQLSLPNINERAEKQAEYERLRAYLEARGVLGPQRSFSTTRGVSIAAHRGVRDQYQCRKTLDACIDLCVGEPRSDTDACIDGCSRHACAAPGRCSDAILRLPL